MRNLDHPSPISMLPKWRIFAPSCLDHCFGGGGDGGLSFHFICPSLIGREGGPGGEWQVRRWRGVETGFNAIFGIACLNFS